MLFHHHGYRICRKTFLFLHGIGEFRLRAIKASYLSQGMVPRVHGLTGRVPSNAFVLEDIMNIVKFILQYAESNAILLPGRVPGYKRDDIQILPSSITKRAVWKLYQNTATTLSRRNVAYSTWCQCWKKFLPHVIVARPMTDLCWTCQQNSTAIIRSVNLSEEEKSEVEIVTHESTQKCVIVTAVYNKNTSIHIGSHVYRLLEQPKFTYYEQLVNGYTTVQL